MIILAGLTESTTNIRTMTEVNSLPIECSISTVKAVQIKLTLYGNNDDFDSTLNLMKYLTDYNHENFYYIDEFNYSEDRSIFKRTTISITLYSFYNDVELKTETNADTNTNTDSKTNTETK